MNDEELEAKIREEVYKIIEKYGHYNDDEAYVTYLILSITAHGLLNYLGEEKFKEFVSVVMKNGPFVLGKK